MNEFSTLLLQHFDKHGRKLPWRENISPYKIWLSEIMLQQTTVVTVIPYFENFLNTFPTVTALAKADLDDVLHLWQGLGYYSRARNLHKCAGVIVAEHNGAFPTSEEALLKLPGIGPYTAAAISSIAFNNVSTVVDGNVERVISRLYRINTPLPTAKGEITVLAKQLNDTQRPSDYSGAIMDLGATICTPRNPKCHMCPVSTLCAGLKHGDAASYPKKLPKKKRPEKTGVAYIIQNEHGDIYLERRPETGLLAKMWQVPNEGWETSEPNTLQHLNIEKPQKIGKIRHVFTHFGLELDVYYARSKASSIKGFFPLDALPPTPTLMKKVIAELQNL